MLLRKFVLVMWKNFLLRKRHWIVTTFEILIPLALFILAAVIRSLSSSALSEEVPERYYPRVDQSELINYISYYSDMEILYAPNNTIASALMNSISEAANKSSRAFENEDSLHRYYNTLNANTRVAAVLFENLSGGLPAELRYKIRISGSKFYTSELFPEFGSGSTFDPYSYSPFLSMQLLVDTAFMELHNINTSEFEYAAQKFPFPKYFSDDSTTVFSIILPLFMVLSYAMLCPSILKRIVEEKETGVKELMKMMGLKTWMLYLGWFVNAIIVNIITITIITILLTVPFGDYAILDHGDFFLVWFTFLLYSASGLIFCFAISSVFSKPTLAMSMGVFLWTLSHSAMTYVVATGSSLPLGVKMLTALLPNTAISWIFRVLVSWETKGPGLSWDNVFSSPNGMENDLTIGLLWVMLIVDMIIYGIITWYFDSIMPGKYGVAKPWYFIFMVQYWLNKKVTDTTASSDDNTGHDSKFEAAPSNLTVGIKIENLRKVYQSLGGTNKKVAVDGVTLDIYNGEITALLGHNGAGKTTTMSIVTGMFSPTSGSVTINGYDIHHNLEKVRENLGLCPQHNLLFTNLTVIEHLIFFAMLKGCSKSTATLEAEALIDRLNLSTKANQMCSTLSGGMKRKLSLGIALIGHTKVLMLDEPTSGLDPEARREMWDLLLSMRGERTILITTHFMEEADVLGDRIAIMDHGRVQCYGTSLFLKKLYGTGYQLNLLKDEGCHVPRVTETVQQIISDAKVKTDMGTVLSYMLPAEQTHNYPDLFDVLERDKQRLGISSIGVSITTLEEVFLRVGKEAEEANGNHINGEIINEEVSKFIYNTEALVFKKSTGSVLLRQQISALFTKRIIHNYRNWVASTLLTLVAIVLVVLTLVLSDDSVDESEPALTFSLKDYGASEVLYTSNGDHKDWSDKYVELVKEAGSNANDVTGTGNNITEALMQRGNADLASYRSKYIIAAEFTSNAIAPVLNALHSSAAYHGAPTSINMLSNAVLSALAPGKSITVTNHPFENKETAGSNALLRGPNITVMALWGTLLPYGLLFIIGGFIRFPITERVSKAKQVQLMTGVSPFLYWFTCFIWDCFYYLVAISIMVLAVFLADPYDAFSRNEELGVFFLIVLMYGLSGIPFSYLFSYFRKSNAGANSILSMVDMLLGMIFAIVVYAMLMAEDYENVGKGLKFIFEFIPHFCVTFAFMRFSDQVFRNNVCTIAKVDCKLLGNDPCCKPDCKDGRCPAFYRSYLEFASDDNPNGLGEQLLYMGINAVLYFGVVMLIEYNVFEKLHDIFLKKTYGTEFEEQFLEEDVLKETERVNNKLRAGTLENGDDIMLVHNLVKKFKKNFTAVKGVSFGVYSGECFGLLGVNGAGKTTTFRMLTGDEIPTSGDARINHYKLKSERHKFLSEIGYCPQFDAINEALTGREMLRLFAKLRGVSPVAVESEIDKWIRKMGLTEYENRRCGTYSGGNKRKLSTAMALIGDPSVIFLDEPTSGVDPVARRNLWNVLTSIQKSGQSIVLTSHSMEECEALCNRLAIMVSGQFTCMGGIQYLKQKFGQGFTVMVKLRAVGTNCDFVNTLKNEIESSFNPGCVLKDEHQGLLHYHVTNPNTPWKHLFLSMERIKHDFEEVEDYTISETTLEQVFLSFAKMQQQTVL
ncbi:phospholipid-transporting ATPase ABCA3-like [Periplaneta americana]|uniref:phospholipid-transporting ATPase ABCA3-like n=1 Tax=Periplaneta americana TaxID=6978 RepID=UPI0037E794E1